MTGISCFDRVVAVSSWPLSFQGPTDLDENSKYDAEYENREPSIDCLTGCGGPQIARRRCGSGFSTIEAGNEKSCTKPKGAENKREPSYHRPQMKKHETLVVHDAALVPLNKYHSCTISGDCASPFPLTR